jgi:hypothetical protein
MRTLSILAASALTLSLLTACGAGSGPAADEGKTPAQVQEQAKTADAATLESTIESYKAELTVAEADWNKLKEEVEAAGKGALDDLMGKADEAGDEAQVALDDLKATLQEAEAHVEALTQNLEVYVKELASRA